MAYLKPIYSVGTTVEQSLTKLIKEKNLGGYNNDFSKI